MGKLICLVLAGTLFLGPLAARKPNKRDVDFFILEEIFPHITFGGPWSTTVTLLNIEDLLAVFPLRFWTTDGQPWQVFVEGVGTSSEFTVTLPPGGSIDIVLPSPGPDIETGWAEIEQPLEATVAGHAIFTDRTEGRPIFEAVVPLGTSVDDQFFLLFDNTNFNNRRHILWFFCSGFAPVHQQVGWTFFQDSLRLDPTGTPVRGRSGRDAGLTQAAHVRLVNSALRGMAGKSHQDRRPRGPFSHPAGRPKPSQRDRFRTFSSYS